MDILANYARFVNRHLRYVVNDEDALPLRRIGWLDDPLVLKLMWQVFLFLTARVKVTVEVSELVRQVVGVRDDVEGLFPESVLHLHDVRTQSVFTSQLKAVGEVVYLLILIHVIINVRLKTLTAPQYVPVV